MAIDATPTSATRISAVGLEQVWLSSDSLSFCTLSLRWFVTAIMFFDKRVFVSLNYWVLMGTLGSQWVLISLNPSSYCLYRY